jgi:hypothetical protein
MIAKASEGEERCKRLVTADDPETDRTGSRFWIASKDGH